MFSMRFKVGLLNVIVGTSGVRLGANVGGTLVSRKVYSFNKFTKTKKKREE